MKYSDFQDEGTDGGDPTQFEPTPWGSRQRVLPRRAFKAAVSVVAPLPGLPAVHAEPTPTPAPAEPAWFVAPTPMLRIESSSFITPIVREADLQTWRVPKLPPPRNAARFDMRRVDMRLWLPITSLVAVLVLAFVGTRSTTTHISAGLTTEAPAITMARIEASAPAPAPIAVAPVAVAPVIAPVVEAPIVEPAEAPIVEAAPVVKHFALAAPVVKQSARTNLRASSAKRPRLDMNVATPLGDLAKHHR